MATTPFVIRNDIQLSHALHRADELMGCTNGSDEEGELAELCDAVDVYTQSMQMLRMVDANPNKASPFASRD